MFESLPGDSAEVDWGGLPSPEFVGLVLLTEEYPEVVMSLPSSLLPQTGGSGPGAGGVWVLGAKVCRSWHPTSSREASSSLDSWQQCCSGFRYTTVTSRMPLGAVTVGEVGERSGHSLSTGVTPAQSRLGGPRVQLSGMAGVALSHLNWTSLDSPVLISFGLRN